MKKLDYLLFVTYKAIAKLNNPSTEITEIKSRTLIWLTMASMFLNFFILGVLLMFLRDYFVITSSWPFLLFVILVYFACSLFMKRRYSSDFDKIISKYELIYSYGKGALYLRLFLILFIPVFLFWGGLLLLSKFW